MWPTYFLNSVYEKIDLYARPLPTFNVRGGLSAPSFAGGVVSFLQMSVLLYYSLNKFEKLLSRANPQVTSYIERGALTADD